MTGDGQSAVPAPADRRGGEEPADGPAAPVRRRTRQLRRRRRAVAVAVGVLLVVAGIGIGWSVAPGPVHRASGRHIPAPTAAAVGSYTNPVIPGDFPDPDVVNTGSEYVALATGTGGIDIPAETSSDLRTWTPHGDALPTVPTWAVASWREVWAPDLVRAGSGWILWFAARDAATGRQCIGFATSPDPVGPFHPAAGPPTVCQTPLGGSIDPSEFVAADGRRWLLWKNDGNCCGDLSQIWSQPLATDGTTLVGQPAAILSYDGGWEDGGSDLRSTIEGPQMVDVHGTFHLFFSGSGYDTSTYAVGHALCDSPVGPCRTTSPFPVLSSFGSVAGPGGESVFADRSGAWWMAYAAWTVPKIGYADGGVRSMRIDRLTFMGTLPVISGPTESPVPLPEASRFPADK